MTRKLLVFFVILLVVMITPAFAVEMEEVAHDAEKYNAESKKNQSFFGKIKLIAKGFKLISRAKEAEKESEKKKEGIEGGVDAKDDDLFKKHKQHILNQKELINYRNSKNRVIVEGIDNNSSSNSTNTNSSDVILTVPTPPRVCVEDIYSFIKLLDFLGIHLLLEEYNRIDNSLSDKLVQIVDSRGYLHYVQVINVVLDGENPGITVNTGSNRVFYTLSEFQTAYTGLKLNLDENSNPSEVLDYIVSKQKDDLSQEKNEAYDIHDKAVKQLFLCGIFMSIAVVLIVVGVILTLVLGTGLIAAAQEAETGVIEFTDVAKKDEFLATANLNREQISGRPETTLKDALRDIKRNLKMAEDPKVKCGDREEFARVLRESYAAQGAELVILAGLPLALHLATQNWLQIILSVVGIILIVVGVALLIAGLVKLVKNGVICYNVNTLIAENRYDSENLREVLDYNSTGNTTTPLI